jgi:ABC-2 type transport system ATP-binding protein
MQRRIGLAQALINDPELLILDEPTSGMDPLGARQFKDLIRTLAARGKTVILSSHLLADVEDVCDRVCILYGGRQRALGRMDELLAKDSLTQITTDKLDPRTLETVRQALAQSGKEIRQVSAPRDKLESLFLRIVQEAQEQRMATGGATSGGPIAEFLRAGPQDAREVLTRLVAAAEFEAISQEAAAQKPAGQAPPAQDTRVLGQLIQLDQPPAEPASPQGAETPPEAPQVDRGVLEGLLGRSEGTQENS